MSGKTQFWLGSVMLALAVGLLVGRAIVSPPAYAQEASYGEGSSRRYKMVTGIRGTAQSTQTIYVVDDVHQVLYAIEYHSKSNEFKMKAISDIRKVTGKLAEARDKGERKKKRP